MSEQENEPALFDITDMDIDESTKLNIVVKGDIQCFRERIEEISQKVEESAVKINEINKQKSALRENMKEKNAQIKQEKAVLSAKIQESKSVEEYVLEQIMYLIKVRSEYAISAYEYYAFGSSGQGLTGEFITIKSKINELQDQSKDAFESVETSFRKKRSLESEYLDICHDYDSCVKELEYEESNCKLYRKRLECLMIELDNKQSLLCDLHHEQLTTCKD